MPRIVGVDIPKQKRIEASLRYIYGVSLATSRRILAMAGINPDVRARELTEEEISKLNTVISQNFKVEGDLRRDVNGNIKRLMNIGCYRGLRHRRGLPARGQRTKTNARTRKGPKKTMANKKK